MTKKEDATTGTAAIKLKSLLGKDTMKMISRTGSQSRFPVIKDKPSSNNMSQVSLKIQHAIKLTEKRVAANNAAL